MARLTRAATRTKTGLGRSNKAGAKKPALKKGSATKRSLAKSSVTQRPKQSSKGTPSWLKKGDDEVAKQKNRGGSSKLFMDIPQLFLKSGERARIRFLQDFEDVTVSVNRHNYRKISQRGSPYFVSFTCAGPDSGCLGCANGDKASARWPVLLVDMRKTDIYEDGRKVPRAGAVKLFMPSIQEHENLRLALEEENEKRARKGEDPVDLRDVIFTITRVGDKAQTAYRFSVFDEEPMPRKYDARFEKFTEKYGDLEKILEPLGAEDQARAIEGASDNQGRRMAAPKKVAEGEDDLYADDDDDDDDDEYLEYDD